MLPNGQTMFRSKKRCWKQRIKSTCEFIVQRTCTIRMLTLHGTNIVYMSG